MSHCSEYSEHFLVHGWDSSGHARHYMSGLLGTQRRKNIGRIGEDIPESNYQGMQQFLSASPWDHAALMRQLAREASALLGGHRDSALYIDETSFVKKGDKSVGVQRQHCGRLGKTENCQVGVFASLGRGERAALVDFRLFLPESWAKDAPRCQKAGVPEAQRAHRTKCELALEMVKQAGESQVSYEWIGADEVYGNNHAFTDALEQLGQTYLMDVAHNLLVWEHKPDTNASHASNKRENNQQGVSTLAAGHFEKESRWVSTRQSTRGPMRVRVWVRRVWVWDGARQDRVRERLLIVRREADGTHKYSLSNAPADTPWEKLAHMQGQRFFIERAFEDAKSELGMAQYELRGWSGWHHHMALCCLAHLFCLKERIGYKESQPLLSVRDIVELLAYYLPRRGRTEGEVLAKMKARHAARAKDIRRRSQAARRAAREVPGKSPPAPSLLSKN